MQKLMKTHRWLFSLAPLLLLLFLLTCDEDDKKSEEEVKDDRVPVEIGSVGRGPIEAVAVSSANLTAESQVKVFSRSTNLVAEMLVEEGDRVLLDQVLARLENETQKIQLAKAEARLAKAQKDFERYEDLFKKELITAQAFNETSYEREQAQLAVAEARQELSYTVIRAPISGTLTVRLVSLGDHVTVNQQLFEIVDFNSIVARVFLSEQNLARLALDQPARLSTSAVAGRAFAGKIRRISPVVDAGTGTVKVTVGVDEIGPLRPGMYVDVTLVMATHPDAILIPKRAMVYDGDQVFIYRLLDGAEPKVARILLEAALMDENFVEPESGFAEGDKIVLAGHTGLKDGARVRILGRTETGDSSAETSPAAATGQSGATKKAEVAVQ